MASPVPRSSLTLHIFGSSGSGKKTLKRSWFDSPHSRVLSEFSDVHLRIQKECVSFDGVGVSCSEELERHSFLILQRAGCQDSLAYAGKCLREIYRKFGPLGKPEVALVDNHFEAAFKPLSPEHEELQLSNSLRSGLLEGPAPRVWRVRVTDAVQILPLFDKVIIQPLLSTLGEADKAMLIEAACRDGKVQVLKLLVGTMSDSQPISWLAHTMGSLEQLVAENGPAAKLLALTNVARYAYNLDTTLSLSTIVRLAEKYPKATLHLLTEFSQCTNSGDHFTLSGLALPLLPTAWMHSSATYTHINLSSNLLSYLPKELLQIATLKGLDVSHNCLQSIPNITMWNCPKLREVNFSHNRLIDVPYCILEGRNRTAASREQILEQPSPAPLKQTRHISAAHRTLRLTGYNLYPCITALTRVNISHNQLLSQVPEWICVLPNLTLLEMTGLPRLTILTPYLSHCRYLCVIRIDFDNLISPPSEEAVKGTRIILAYLRCQLRGSTPYRHLKLVIVGGEGSGKSTLFSQMLRSGPKSDNPQQQPSMDIATFEYPPRMRVRKDRPRITFHVIDFAGQEIYRCTHQCFLTYRSIYLCLWDVTEGIDSLRRVCFWLRMIQACVPGSPVVLVATHIDRRPGLSAATILQWERDVLGDVSQLKSHHYSSSLGLPPIMQSVVMDCQNREDVELLLADVYTIALQMQKPHSKLLLMEEMLPRSYQELQSLVEVKVRSLCRDVYSAPIVRHEELVDYVRRFTIHHPNDLDQDEEEFALACNFLHDAGAIIRFKSQVTGMSDLYFLDPQWLFNALAAIISFWYHRPRLNPVISSDCLPNDFERAGIPPQFYNSFLCMMESFSILVGLDMEKRYFLVPSFLPDVPPEGYPVYDLSDGHNKSMVTNYIQLDYLPPSLFPHLIARVLVYIRQLSGQLLAISDNLLTLDRDDSELLGSVEDFPDGGLLSRTLGSMSSLLNRSYSFHLDRLGYVCHDELSTAGNEGTLRNKIWALSHSNVMSTPTTRHKALTEKLVTISQPILRQRASTSVGSSSSADIDEQNTSLTHCDSFSSHMFWKKGLFVEFPCGTKFWLEACTSAIAIVISGEAVPRVKVLSFLSSCTNALVEESYGGLKVTSYSPCLSCLSSFWERSKAAASLGQAASFADSSLEVSQVVTLNEFKETIHYSHRPSVESRYTRSQTFTDFKISRSPSPPQPSSPQEDDTPTIAILEDKLTLFPLATTIQHSIMSSTILCPKCQCRVPLKSISPHVFLVDFTDKLLLESKLLSFTEDKSSALGRGGYGKVYRGTYSGEPVAVKVFRKPYKYDVLLNRYKDLREELTIMSHLQHPRVVALVGVCFRPLCMVLQLAPQGSLSDHLRFCPHGLQTNTAHRLLYQIADGICYLHSLFIIHRDIKPSNVLVWSLHPRQGVDIRLADYGVSQFATPSGLRRHKGTEEYMAPELFRGDGTLTYDEKVDIFSFALVLHLVVTGRKLFAGTLSKQDQMQLIYHSDIPQLGAALADALEDDSPPHAPSSDGTSVVPLEDGKHPAARSEVITACHSVCMQRLLEDCVAIKPHNRPTAQGVCSQLLVCPGGKPQANFFIMTSVKSAAYSRASNVIVAIKETFESVVLLPTDSWEVQLPSIPYSGERITCLTVVGSEVLMASQGSNLVFSLDLPTLQAGHISPQPLVGEPLCIFPYVAPSGTGIIVGMSGGRLAIFTPHPDGGHLLNSQPTVMQVMEHIDALKTAICCGTFHHRTVWCGCGRYVIGLEPRDFLMKYIKPVTREDTLVTKVAGCHSNLWVKFEQRCEVAMCSAVDASLQELLNCHTILNKSNVTSSQAIVTDIATGHGAVWVGTKGGYLIAFNPLTADVLLVHQRHSSVSSVVCIGEQQVVTFGAQGCEGSEEEEETTSGMFTIWTSFINSGH